MRFPEPSPCASPRADGGRERLLDCGRLRSAMLVPSRDAAAMIRLPDSRLLNGARPYCPLIEVAQPEDLSRSLPGQGTLVTGRPRPLAADPPEPPPPAGP